MEIESVENEWRIKFLVIVVFRFAVLWPNVNVFAYSIRSQYAHTIHTQ